MGFNMPCSRWEEGGAGEDQALHSIAQSHVLPDLTGLGAVCGINRKASALWHR